jgi:hypothetical protein
LAIPWMRIPNWSTIADAVINVALFALGCVVLYAIAKALFELLNVVLPSVIERPSPVRRGDRRCRLAREVNVPLTGSL